MSFTLNQLSIPGMILNWVLTLYITTGWILSFQSHKEGNPLTLEAFPGFCKQTNSFLVNFVFAQMYLHFLGLLMGVILLTLFGIYLSFSAPNFITIFSGIFVNSGSLLYDLRTEYREYLENFSRYDLIFYLVFFGLAILLGIFYVLAGFVLSAVVVLEKKKPFQCVERAIELMTPRLKSLYFNFSILMIMGVAAMLFTLFLGSIFIIPLFSVLPYIIYTNLTKEDESAKTLGF